MESLGVSSEVTIKHYNAAFGNFVKNPPDPRDPFFKYYGQACIDLIKEEAAVQDEFLDIASHRPNDSAFYIADIGLRVIHNDVLLGFNGSYPYAYSGVEPFKGLVRNALFENADANWHYFRKREIQSNVDERGKIVKLTVNMFPDRFNGPIKILELGASRNNILKRLAQEDDELYRFDSVVPQRADFNTYINKPLKSHWRLAEYINESYLRKPLLIEKGTGVDTALMRDMGNFVWTLACSHYPKEMANVRKRKRFNDLQNEVPNIHFVNAACDNEEELTSKIGNEKQDVVFMSYMLYQNTDEQIAKIIANAKQHISEDGIILIFDSVDKDDTKPNGLRFAPKRYSSDRPYGCKVLMFDMKEPDLGWQELFRFENGRAHKVILNTQSKLISNALQN